MRGSLPGRNRALKARAPESFDGNLEILADCLHLMPAGPSLKSLRTGLLARLAQLVSPRGYRKREQSFVKEAGAVRVSLHVAFVNHAQDFDVTADVAIRHHAVEELLAAGAPPPRSLEPSTIGAELGNLAGVGQHRWMVQVEADVEPVAQAIVTYFDQHGEPFLTRFSDAQELLRALEEDGPEARLICPLPDRRRRVRESLRTVVGAR